jgi:energy-coupling factor transport system ATP-binding protein
MAGLVDVEQLSYWYPSQATAAPDAETPALEQAALKDVSLRFEPGEFVLVVGPSGCGKSTLIQALLGVVPALTGGTVAGRVLLDGREVLAGGLAQVAGQIGLVLQDPESQLTNLDVEGEVVFGPENLGLPREEIATRLDRALAAADIAHLRHAFVYALSGGQKQRVAIAAGLAMRPRVLLLDSPTSNLDPLGSEETLAATIDLWRQGAVELIVMTAHKIDDVLPYATRLVVMADGRIRFDGRPEAILGQHLAALRDDLGIFVPEVCELAVRVGHVGSPPPTTLAQVAELLRAAPPPPAASSLTADPISDAPVPAVEVVDLHFAYRPGAPVLNGVSLAIGRGQFVALLGQNGAGKTTLAKNIAGLYRPTRGTIQLGGVEATSSTLHLQTGKVGYVFQYPDHQFVALTVADELAYGLRARGMAEPDVEARVEEMLALFQLTARRDAAPYGLSMGEKRRLSVATMLVLQPEVLILDEPTTGQDRRNTVALMEVLRQEARSRGLTIIQITHDMEQAAEYADRMVVMEGGRIVFDGTVQRLFARPELLERCHLKPTPTSIACRMAWPDLDVVPATPAQLDRLLGRDVPLPLARGAPCR